MLASCRPADEASSLGRFKKSGHGSSSESFRAMDSASALCGAKISTGDIPASIIFFTSFGHAPAIPRVSAVMEVDKTSSSGTARSEWLTRRQERPMRSSQQRTSPVFATLPLISKSWVDFGARATASS